MEFWIKAAQLLTSLSILVILHEFGHFLPAKLFKTRVEKFYLFFNPWFSVFKFKKGETEYGMGWLPLGGYVKIAGMIDESMDTEQMNKPAQPWEFRSKPAWQRLIIMLGGVIVNLIVGFVAFALILFVWGKETLEPQNVKYGVACDPFMIHHGMQDGDKIMALNGESIASFQAARIALLLDDIRSMTVERDGQMIDLKLPEDFGQLMVDSGIRAPFDMRIPTVIGEIAEGFPAEKGGLLVGDSLVGINGKGTIFFNEIAEEIGANTGGNVDLDFYRDGQLMHANIEVNEEGQIGFRPVDDLDRFFDIRHDEFTFLQAIPAGFAHARETIIQYVISMKFVFSPSGAKQIGGFAAIGNLFSPTWDWQSFWEKTAWLSLVLAVMNILPIPALDGGHVMFLLYEMIAGRPPGQKFLERAQMVGIILLLGLLLFANGNDIYRGLFGD